MSHTDNAERGALKADGPPGSKSEQCGKNVFRHAARIASGSIPDNDSARIAIREVNVVVPDCRRGDEPYPGAFQKVLVASGPGPDNQCVRIHQVCPANLYARPVHNLRIRFEDSLQEGNGLIRHYLYLSVHHFKIIPFKYFLLPGFPAFTGSEATSAFMEAAISSFWK